MKKYMKLLRVRHVLAFALFLLLSSKAQAQSSPLWSDLKPGPHAVGFKSVKAYDYSRVARKKLTDDGKPYTGERAMPLMISLWYPAKKTGEARITFESYLYAGSMNETFAELTAAEKRAARESLRSFFERPQNFPFGKLPEEAWSRLLKTKTEAVENAEAEEGPFPLIIGSSSIAGLSITNEYLASHGYIVAFVTPLIRSNLSGVLRTESSVRDLEYLIGYLRGHPNADHNRLGAMGFSGGGFAPYMLAMRNTDVDAVVTLESAIFMPRFSSSLKPSPSFDATKMTAPLLHAFRKKQSEEDEDLSDFESLRYSKRHRFLLNDESLLHQDFGAYGIAATTVLDLRGKDRQASRLAFELTCRYVLHFLNAHVKKDLASREWLNRKPEENAAPAGFLTFEIKEAVKPESN